MSATADLFRHEVHLTQLVDDLVNRRLLALRHTHMYIYTNSQSDKRHNHNTSKITVCSMYEYSRMKVMTDLFLG
jgi:hypothetical protein